MSRNISRHKIELEKKDLEKYIEKDEKFIRVIYAKPAPRRDGVEIMIVKTDPKKARSCNKCGKELKSKSGKILHQRACEG